MNKQTIGYLYNRIQFSNIKEKSIFIRCKNSYETKKVLSEIVKQAELIHDGKKVKTVILYGGVRGFQSGLYICLNSKCTIPRVNPMADYELGMILMCQYRFILAKERYVQF